jgi:glycosyltransferase involved in cell wall biosynthesis
MSSVNENQQRKDPRILYLWGTKVPPSLELNRNPTYWLSQTLRGEVLQLLWWSEARAIENLGAQNVPVMQVGRFRHHFLLIRKGSSVRKWWRMVRHFIREGIRLHREEPFDCIVVYSHMTSGICGVILKLLLRRKLVIQIVTSPENIGITSGPSRTMRDRLIQLYSDISLHVSCLSADRLHLFGPDLLKPFRLLKDHPASVFPNFTNASLVPKGEPASSSTILMAGSPWYLKGADILAKAFLQLAGDFPDAQLKFLGHFTQTADLEAIIGGYSRIEILGARPKLEALSIISSSGVTVLASRCEGVPRVFVEAMNAGIPIVGSNVGGIPQLIRDGENGFIFSSEDVDALERILRKLLASPELRARLGARGREIASKELDEQRFVERFTNMVRRTVES